MGTVQVRQRQNQWGAGQPHPEEDSNSQTGTDMTDRGWGKKIHDTLGCEEGH